MSDDDGWFFAPVDGHGILVLLVNFFMNGNKTITNSWLPQALITWYPPTAVLTKRVHDY